MTHYLDIVGKSISQQIYMDNEVCLSSNYEVTIGCMALREPAAKPIVDKYDLSALADPPPEECYPYPGEWDGCLQCWKTPADVRDAALRFAQFLTSIPFEEKEIFRQTVFDWDLGKYPKLTDVDLDKFLVDMKNGFEDLAMNAEKMRGLGEGLVILLFG